ncbi:ribosomal protein S18-alanine N-acetyltransferase [Halovenus marina]|uniref:ribosomal protein S18-alanine N-acetyltransferase n=1 Tax=Halovenus marina TaxID=3396621 RepID=UPI003F550CCB
MTTASQSHRSRRIRQAERADLLAVHRIERAVFPQPWPFGAFERYLGEPGFLVAEGSSLLGYVVADTVTAHGRALGHVKDLAVHPDCRREGIASHLLTRAFSVLDGQGARSVKLEVRETNDQAQHLYREHGFSYRRTVPEYYDDDEDALIFVRSL